MPGRKVALTEAELAAVNKFRGSEGLPPIAITTEEERIKVGIRLSPTAHAALSELCNHFGLTNQLGRPDISELCEQIGLGNIRITY